MDLVFRNNLMQHNLFIDIRAVFTGFSSNASTSTSLYDLAVIVNN